MIKVTRQTDPELAALVVEELNRQEHNIEMIASDEYRTAGSYGTERQRIYQ